MRRDRTVTSRFARTSDTSGIPSSAVFIRATTARSTSTSSPKTFTATSASVPERTAPMRCAIG